MQLLFLRRMNFPEVDLQQSVPTSAPVQSVPESLSQSTESTCICPSSRCCWTCPEGVEDSCFDQLLLAGVYSRSWDLELPSSWSSKQRWEEPKPQSSLLVQLVFLASCEGETRLIVSTLLLQVPRGLVQVHQLLVPVFLFLPTPDLETLLQSATADKRRKEGTSLRECVVSLQLCGEVQYCLGGGGHGGGLGQLGGEGAGQHYTGQRSVLVSLGWFELV